MRADLTYRDESFSVETSDDDGFRARFTGNADVDAATPLAALLPRLHAELLRLGAKEIEIDLRELEFMNAACMKLLVMWVADILDVPSDQRYRLRFRPNPEVRWQRRSLVALQCFMTDVVVVDL
ncbi:MAG: hypothetical protein ACKV2T_11845 [Kofleriaceae bacterium]